MTSGDLNSTVFDVTSSIGSSWGGIPAGGDTARGGLADRRGSLRAAASGIGSHLVMMAGHSNSGVVNVKEDTASISDVNVGAGGPSLGGLAGTAASTLGVGSWSRDSHLVEMAMGNDSALSAVNVSTASTGTGMMGG